MEKDIDRIIKKLDSIQDDITDIKVHNATQTADIRRNTKDLAEHIEGVMQNRTRIEGLELSCNKLGIVWKTALSILTIAGTIFGIIKYFM